MLEVARLGLAVTASLGLAAGPARADGEIATDRPDFTETAIVVPRGMRQIEIGITYQTAGAPSEYAFPEALLRAGLGRRLELRLQGPDYIRVDDGGTTDHRVGEAAFGAKLQLLEDDATWGVALLPMIAVPLDRDEKARPTPDLALAWSRALPRDWSIAGQFGHTWLGAVERGTNTLAQTVSLGAPVGASMGAFLEWAAEYADGAEPAHLLHHGYTFAAGADLQLDVHAGAGLTGDTPDFFIGAGLGWRQPSRR
jgi:hypothetical protein